MRPEAHIVHALPGRTRIKVPSMRGDETYFADTARCLRSQLAVTAVAVNHRTASILLEHDPGWSIAEDADGAGEIAGFTVVPEHDRAIPSLWPRRGAPAVDLPWLSPSLSRKTAAAALIAIAVRQVQSGHLFGPAISHVMEAVALMGLLDRQTPASRSGSGSGRDA